MNFEVNGQTYFLGFSGADGVLALFATTPSGVRQLQIASDDGSISMVVLDQVPDDEGTSRLN